MYILKLFWWEHFSSILLANFKYVIINYSHYVFTLDPWPIFLLIFVTINLLNFWQHNECEMISHYCFNFHSPGWLVEPVHFSILLLAFVFFFCELPIHIICSIFIVLCVFFLLIYIRSWCILAINSLCVKCVLTMSLNLLLVI